MSIPAYNNEWQESVRENIRNGAELNIAFVLMTVLAATIASYGLFANSPAVIIGAMIVAMLLGPIGGIALSLVDSNPRLLLTSLLTLVSGTIVVMVTALVIGWLHNDILITDEIMARTHPNLIDLMIALAGGAAGAYASVSPRLSTTLVGVAIATALVPPLSSASILFVHGEMNLGLGAFFLALTNMVAIQFAFSVVLWVTGFRRVSHTSGLSVLVFFKRNALSILILLVMAIVLTHSLRETVANQMFETTTRMTLQQAIDGSPGFHLVETRFAKSSEEDMPQTTLIRAVVRGPNPISAPHVAALENKLPSPPDGTAIELRIRFVQTVIMNRDGVLRADIGFGLTE